MKFGSLFSGIGGFDLALERAGMTCAWQCENDPKASAILKRHWPNVENVGDVHDVRRGRVEPVDLICGGFPCQDLSIAGKRAGLAGKRSGLWYEFARVIDEFEPGWVIAENVPGLLSSDEGKDFAIIIQWLAKRGYGVAWRVLDAQYFGLAQRRRRVFIVGHLGSGSAAEVLFESEGLLGDPPTRRQAGERTASVFTTRVGEDGGGNGFLENKDHAMPISGQPQYLEPVVFQQNIRDEVRLFGGDGKSAHGAYGKIAIALGVTESNGSGISEEGTSYSLEAVNSANQAVMVVMAHGQANAEIVSDGSPSLTDNHEAPIVWEMQHASEGYRESGEQSPSCFAGLGTGGNNVPLVGVRRLTPTECERLQGFPDGWTDGQADSSRYRQLGNAVAVPVVEWIAKRVYAIHKASYA